MNEMSWTTELLRRSISLRPNQGEIAHWAGELIDVLKEFKPDHEVFVFGVSRDLKTPNYLLATSQEMVFTPPLRITMNRRTADVFIGSGNTEVRLLSQEFPMGVNCHPEGEDRKIPLNFYEAVCFDCGGISIILGLIVHDGTLDEFLTQQEIVELHPLIHSHAVPLFELYLARAHAARSEKDVGLLINLMRENDPNAAQVELPPAEARRDQEVIEEDGEESPETEIFTAPFIQYVARELGVYLRDSDQYLNQLAQHGPDVRRVAGSLQRGIRLQQNILRNLLNLATLSNPEVRPNEERCNLAELAGRAQSAALRLAEPFQLTVKRDDRVQNLQVRADVETLSKLIERLLQHLAALCMHGTITIRIRGDGETPADGFGALEIEDSGALPSGGSLDELLNGQAYSTSSHPRLLNGGGVLLQLLALYMRRTGGQFLLHPGKGGGLTTAFLLPVVEEARLRILDDGVDAQSPADSGTGPHPSAVSNRPEAP